MTFLGYLENEVKKGHNSQSLPENGRKKKNRKLRLFYAEGITIWEKGMCTFPLSLHFEKLFLRLYTVGSLFGPHDMVTVWGFLFFSPSSLP